MVETVLAVIGPPAVGKTTLTNMLSLVPGFEVFRLRDHVPEALLAAATAAPGHGCIDDVTVARVLRTYLQAATASSARVIVIDDFPTSGMQAELLVSAVRKVAPPCSVRVVELLAEPETMQRRIRERRVCHHCERDPVHDPHLPAEPSPADPRRCVHCDSILQPRRGDAPRLVVARICSYQESIADIYAAFARLGINMQQLDGNLAAGQTADDLLRLLAASAQTTTAWIG